MAHPTVTALWSPIRDDDIAFEVRGQHAGYEAGVEVFSVEIRDGEHWRAPKDDALRRIIELVLQPVADADAARRLQEWRERMVDAIEEKAEIERKERQHHHRIAAE